MFCTIWSNKNVLYLLLFGHVADVNWPLVELSHHQDGGHCLLLSVGHDGHLLGPLLKVLQNRNRLLGGPE